MSELKTNLITPYAGTTVTMGESGDTVALAAGATATGFGGGKILQVQSSFNGTGAQTTTRNVYAEIGTAVTLTPTATSSTILLFARGNSYIQGNTGSGYAVVYFSIQRSLGGVATDDISTKSSVYYDARNAGTLFGHLSSDITTHGKDSPSTTSELTYQAQYYSAAGPGGWPGASGVYNIDLIAMEIGV